MEPTNITIKSMLPEDMPREKLSNKGRAHLSNAELLAILINTGTKECSAIQLAQEMLNKFGGIKNLAELNLKDIMEFKGIKEAKACRIVAGLELAKRISKEIGKDSFSANSPSSTASLFMEELRYEKKEHFKVLFLNTKLKMIGDSTISIGSLNAGLIHPREVFKEAVSRSSYAIILVHNHPSGDPSPSKEDIAITKQLKEAGAILGIFVLDHIIIGDGTFFSFKEKGMI